MVHQDRNIALMIVIGKRIVLMILTRKDMHLQIVTGKGIVVFKGKQYRSIDCNRQGMVFMIGNSIDFIIVTERVYFQ